MSYTIRHEITACTTTKAKDYTKIYSNKREITADTGPKDGRRWADAFQDASSGPKQIALYKEGNKYNKREKEKERNTRKQNTD